MSVGLKYKVAYTIPSGPMVVFVSRKGIEVSENSKVNLMVLWHEFRYLKNSCSSCRPCNQMPILLSMNRIHR